MKESNKQRTERLEREHNIKCLNVVKLDIIKEALKLGAILVPISIAIAILVLVV